MTPSPCLRPRAPELEGKKMRARRWHFLALIFLPLWVGGAGQGTQRERRFVESFPSRGGARRGMGRLGFYQPAAAVGMMGRVAGRSDFPPTLASLFCSLHCNTSKSFARREDLGCPFSTAETQRSSASFAPLRFLGRCGSAALCLFAAIPIWNSSSNDARCGKWCLAAKPDTGLWPGYVPV